jgi:GT2 family glycosyltransferase
MSTEYATPAMVFGLTLNYRQSELTARCVESMLAEGVVNILVWDNSDDHGASHGELLRLFSCATEVVVVKSDRNTGFSNGVNDALAFLRKTYRACRVLLLNNDAVLVPGAVSLLNRAADLNEHAYLVYPTVSHAGSVRGTVHYHIPTGLLFDRAVCCSFPYASGCCQLLLLDRHETDFFDRSYFMYGEDWEQGWSMGPGRMHHVDRVLVLHEGSASSGMATAFYEDHILEAHFRIAGRVARSLPELIVLSAIRVVVMGLRAVLRSVRYKSFQPLCSWMKALSWLRGFAAQWSRQEDRQ